MSSNPLPPVAAALLAAIRPASCDGCLTLGQAAGIRLCRERVGEACRQPVPEFRTVDEAAEAHP